MLILVSACTTGGTTVVTNETSEIAGDREVDETAIVPVSLMFGEPVGQLALGVSQPSDAKKVFKDYGGIGGSRRSSFELDLGGGMLKPRKLYNPPASVLQLHFDGNNRLVLVVNGMPSDMPMTSAEFTTKYSDAQETDRQPGWYQLQTQVSDCVWIVAVFSQDDRFFRLIAA